MEITFQDSDIPQATKDVLESALAEAEGLAQNLGHHTDSVKVEVRLYDGIRNKKVHPEMGVSAGILKADNTFAIVIDPDRIDDPKVIGNFKSLSVHEMNHLELNRRMGRDPETLAEVLVSEGFAQVAEEAAGFSPFAKNLLSPRELAGFKLKITPHLEDLLFTDPRPEQEFSYWFSGDQDDQAHNDFAPHSGYTLAFNIVSGYLKYTGMTLEQGMRVPAGDIVNHWRYG